MVRDILHEVEGLLPERVVFSLKKELKISEDLDREVDTAARTYGFYAILAEKAESRYQRMEFAFKTWSAEVEAREAKSRELAKEKPYTEARMKAFVRSQPKYKHFQLKLIEYGEQKRILTIIAKSFELKAELVRTKAANRRKEQYGSG
jgi:hypothetical protein